ncbi:MAG: hypothetical protein ACTSPB_12605 [Candidatus Thorarchaeota archaeon]
MNCMKCRLRRWYYVLLKWLMLPVRKLASGVSIKDQVIATLIKDGKIIGHFTGVKMHNKWWDGEGVGLDLLSDLIVYGGTAAGACEVKQMAVGSTCGDDSFALLDSWRDTENTDPGFAQAKFTATWSEAGAINGICQVALKMNNIGGGGAVISACYNFGTTFDKPDGVSLKIEWTTTLTS